MPIFRRQGGAENLELLDRVLNGVDPGIAVIVFRGRADHAIFEQADKIVASARDMETTQAAGISIARIGHARRDVQDVLGIALVERQFREILALQHRARGRGLGFQQRRGRLHFHRLGDIA